MLRGPFVVYVAAAGTAEPDRVDQDPPEATWTRLVSVGKLAEKAVAVDFVSEYGEFRAADLADVSDVWLAGRKLMVELGTVEVEPDLFGRVLDATVTVTAAKQGDQAAVRPGHKSVVLSSGNIGDSLSRKAIIVQGRVSGTEGFRAWYYASHAVLVPASVKGTPTRTKMMEVDLAIRSVLGADAAASIVYREQTEATPEPA